MDAGVTVDQVQNILIAAAPIIGTPRTLDAALNITEALGIVIAVVEAELEAEEEAQEPAEQPQGRSASGGRAASG